MNAFTTLDLVAVAFFVAAWIGYHLAVERGPGSGSGLNQLMDSHRQGWMEQMALRENRIVDTTIMASLQNGTAFFASTSLLAIGGALALLQSTESVVGLLADLPFGLAPTRLAWELKCIGLLIVFVYAFFKFAWSYRLFNYAAILMGATPVRGDPATPSAARRAGAMSVVAGRHFNRGQRAFFFALGYLGWFANAWIFIGATAAVLFVMWQRQFASDARSALRDAEPVP